MFFRLPEEIISYIYEFDSTYHEKMKECLKYIQKYEIYSIANNYYIYDPDINTLHMTDSIESPSYICSSFEIDCEIFSTIKKKNNLKRNFNLILKYNIDNFSFYM